MNQYKEVKLHYSVAVRHDSTLEWLIPFSQLVAFLRTLTSYRAYMKEHPGVDPVEDVHRELKDAFSVGDRRHRPHCKLHLSCIHCIY